MFRVEDYIKNYSLDEYGVWAYPENCLYDELPMNGIKIHISAIPQNSAYIFNAVYPFIKRNKLSFKVISSDEILMRQNRGEFGYSQLGKFITIYPKSQDELIQTTQTLHELTIGFSSIKIPSDYRYANDSIVYFRFGEFKSNDSFMDNRLSVLNEKTKIPEELRLLQIERSSIDGYLPINCIRARGKSRVYFGIMNKNYQNVIIKMWNHIGEEVNFSGFELFKNEYLFLKLCKNFNFIPNIIDSFYYKDSYVVVEEFLNGKPLETIMQSPISLKKRKNLIKELVFSLKRIIKKGFLPYDISPSNILLEDDKVQLIDFEYYRLLKDKLINYNFGTPGFVSDQVAPDKQCIFSVAMINFYLQNEEKYKAYLKNSICSIEDTELIYNKYSSIFSNDKLTLEESLDQLFCSLDKE